MLVSFSNTSSINLNNPSHSSSVYYLLFKRILNSELIMYKIILCFVVILQGHLNNGQVVEDPPGLWDPIWTWSCEKYEGHTTLDSTCLRKPYDNTTDPQRVPLKTCWLTCGEYGPLWPYPTVHTVLGKELTSFLPSNINLIIDGLVTDVIRQMIEETMAITIGHINQTYNNGVENSNSMRSRGATTAVDVTISVEESTQSTIRLDTDESYLLKVSIGLTDKVEVTIIGNTYFGVRHALETFTQLIAYNEDLNLLQIINQVDISDKPTFRYRGLMIDTGRNFIPIVNLKKMVDAMAYNKFNMFHWHLSDSNSFPFLSKSEPEVTRYGVFSRSKVYRPEEIQEFIRYANLRGIKIIPELDAPSHAGNGWQWGEAAGLGNLSLCINAQPYRDYCIQPPCGQLNPLNENTLTVLGNLFKDFLDVFDKDFFHMGNDEISFDCWLDYPEITEWLKQQGTEDLMDLWGLFQQKSLAQLKAANGGIPISPIVWTSEMTVRGRRFLSPEDYVIQIWNYSNDTSIREILIENYRVIFSNEDRVYLDHGYGGWRNFRNVEIKYWQSLYDYDILSLAESFVGKEKTDELYASGKLFGGEACLWAEKVDKHNMEMKLWPRGAAMAERLWSNPPGNTNAAHKAYPRLLLHRERMIERGVDPDTLAPESCHHIWGFCDDVVPGDITTTTTPAPASAFQTIPSVSILFVVITLLGLV